MVHPLARQTPGQPIPLGMAAEDRIKQLEQQKNRVAVDAYGQGTESEKYDPYKYLCDVFRRIKKTAKDQLVNLVAHKWQPQMAPAIY